MQSYVIVQKGYVLDDLEVIVGRLDSCRVSLIVDVIHFVIVIVIVIMFVTRFFVR